MRRVLIAGSAGQLGRELARIVGWPEDVELVAPSEDAFDVTDRGCVRQVVESVRPEVIVNAAAYTAVDRAEDEPELARAVNVDAVGHLADAADEAGAGLVHFSTDYVFDGRREGRYTERDRPNPLGVYGATKLAGEQRALAARHGLVLRTSWLYGALGGNFVRTMRRLARERDRIGVVHDQRGCPTAAPALAEAVRAILEVDPRPHGLYHAAAPDEATWWELAVEAVAGLEPRATVEIEPLTTEQYPTRAARPANSRLSSAALAADFGVRLPRWRESLSEVSRELNVLEAAGARP